MELSSSLIAALVTLLAVAVFLLWLGLRAQKKPCLTGNAAMKGETGIVKKTAGFRNRIVVEIRGENWWSRSAAGEKLEPGDEIAVIDVDRKDLVLIVEKTGRS